MSDCIGSNGWASFTQAAVSSSNLKKKKNTADKLYIESDQIKFSIRNSNIIKMSQLLHPLMTSTGAFNSFKQSKIYTENSLIDENRSIYTIHAGTDMLSSEYLKS